MADIDDFDKDINEQLDVIERDLEGLEKKEPSQRLKLIGKCEQKVQSTQMAIESYELEIHSLSKVQAVPYKDSLQKITERMKKIKKIIDSRKDESSSKNTLFANKNSDDMDANATLIEMGNKIQEKSMDSLQNTLNMVNQANATADEINLELDKQIKQITHITEDVKETQVIIKRANEYLKYFARQVYTDKLLMCLIFLIAIAILVIIGYKIFGGSTYKRPGDSVVLNTGNTTTNTTRLLFEPFLG
jgi:SNARE protein